MKQAFDYIQVYKMGRTQRESLEDGTQLFVLNLCGIKKL